MKSTHSLKFLRKRKLLMVLPLLTLPFLTLLFWILGGGQVSAKELNITEPKGLNFQLPDPRLDDAIKENKLSFYDKAQEDSIKLRQAIQNDPDYQYQMDSSQTTLYTPSILDSASAQNGLSSSPYNSPSPSTSNEEKIYQRLNALNKAIENPLEEKSQPFNTRSNDQTQYNKTEHSEDMDRLEGMMEGFTRKATQDPEIAQLGNMLDKIIDIQQPEKSRGNTKQKSLEKKTRVFPVNSTIELPSVSFLGSSKTELNDTAKNRKRWSFLGTSNRLVDANDLNAISAVVHETQTVTAGSTIKLRLLNDLYINGSLIEMGSFVFGTAALENERLLINIPGIRNGNSLLPVSLEVYDMDGLAGVYIPGSISRDVAKQSAEQSLQGIELMSLDPSLKVQAATAGIQAAKGLISRKVKLIKVIIKAGYKVLLKDGNKQEN